MVVYAEVCVGGEIEVDGEESARESGRGGEVDGGVCFVVGEELVPFLLSSFIEDDDVSSKVPLPLG